MWHDMKLYWAWRGPSKADSRPPTDRRVGYAKIIGPGVNLNGDNHGQLTEQRLAVKVYDDGVSHDVNTDELAFHAKYGAKILMPEQSDAEPARNIFRTS